MSFFGNSPAAASNNLNHAIELLENNNIESAKNYLKDARYHLQSVHDIAQAKIKENKNSVSMVMSSMHYQVSFTEKHIRTIDNCLATLPYRKEHIISVLKGEKEFSE